MAEKKSQLSIKNYKTSKFTFKWYETCDIWILYVFVKQTLGQILVLKSLNI